MHQRFKGQSVVITGAASGLGLLLSQLFDAAEAHVLGIDINPDALSTAASKLSDRFTPLVCDLSDREQIAAVFKEIYALTPHVDILINNAGIVYGETLENHEPHQIERTFAVNTLSHFYTIGAVWGQMKTRNSGHIVSIASAGGFIGTPKLSAYCASKFAAVGIEESLRGEIRAAGLSIHSTLIAPYFINTGMFSGVKSRFPFLLPVMEPEYVARRIFGAIARKKRRLILPWFAYTVFPMRMLPVRWFDALVDFFGITRAMEGFSGRKSS